MTKAIVDCAIASATTSWKPAISAVPKTPAEAGLRGAPERVRALGARGPGHLGPGRARRPRTLADRSRPRPRHRPTSSASARDLGHDPSLSRSAGRRCAAPPRPVSDPSARRRRGAPGPGPPRPAGRPRSGSGRSGRRRRGVSTPAATAAAKNDDPPRTVSATTSPAQPTSRSAGSGSSSASERPPAHPLTRRADVPDGIAALPATGWRASGHHLPGGSQRVGLGVEGADPSRCARAGRAPTSSSASQHDKSPRAASGFAGRLFGQPLLDSDGGPSVGVTASEQRRADPECLTSSASAERCEPARCARLRAARPARRRDRPVTAVVTGWRLVMPPSRQIGFLKSFLEWFLESSPAEKFFGAILPGHRRLGTLLGTRSGTRGNACGTASRRASSSVVANRCRPRDWHSPDRRNATRRRSRSRPRHHGGCSRPGPGAGPRRWSRSGRSWTRTARGSRGCGHGHAGASAARFRRPPSAHAVLTMATMWGRRARRSISARVRIRWASHGVPSAVLVAYLAT